MEIGKKLFLKTLVIKNFATIENQTIEFSNHFNAIVGETGSGKSLILEALQLVFGQRADKKIIRKDCEFAIIEAIFHVSGDTIKEYFESCNHPYDGNEIVIKRIIYKDQSSKSFLNFQACPLSTLCLFATNFIDVVGQFENQKLLNSNYQLEMLDSFSNLTKKVEEYQKDFNQLNELQNNMESLKRGLGELKSKEDYFLFQIEKIENLDPSNENEQELIAKKSSLLEHDKKRNLGSKILERLSDDDSSNVILEIKSIISLLNKSEFNLGSNLVEKLHTALGIVEEISFDLSSQFANQQDVEKELQQVMDRLDSYQKLKRKFGPTTDELLINYNVFKESISNIKKIESNIKTLSGEINDLKNQTLIKANVLHSSRDKNSKKLSTQLTSLIRELKMTGATVDIAISKIQDLSKNGITKLSFNAETNPGEGYFKVKNIASGGELSRILLAFRRALSANDSISIFLFDEIDAGIGGETALSIGKALQEVSCNSQVLTVTHLPQIANFADKLIHVEKEIKEIQKGAPKTKSIIKELKEGEKQKFIKNMTPIQS